MRWRTSRSQLYRSPAGGGKRVTMAVSWSMSSSAWSCRNPCSARLRSQGWSDPSICCHRNRADARSCPVWRTVAASGPSQFGAPGCEAVITASVVGWVASVVLLSAALGNTTYALGTGAALAIWSVVAVVTVEAVRRRDELDRFAPLALAASAALFAVLAFDVVA